MVPRLGRNLTETPIRAGFDQKGECSKKADAKAPSQCSFQKLAPLFCAHGYVQ